MAYYFAKTVTQSFGETIARVVEELKKEGFGLITEIDVQETLKAKLDVDFRKYRILGACNPALAHQALQVEDNIGLLLPCNVIVQEKSEGSSGGVRHRPGIGGRGSAGADQAETGD